MEDRFVLDFPMDGRGSAIGQSRTSNRSVNMDERDKSMIKDFRRRLPEELRKQVTKLIFYGSRARGGASADSDLDLIAIVTQRTPEVEKALEDIAYDVMWQFDFRPTISLKVFSESQFQGAIDKGFSFYRHVLEEGLPV